MDSHPTSAVPITPRHWWPRLVRHRSGQVGGVLVALFLLAAGLGPILAPYDHEQQHASWENAPPSAEHWLGGDHLGRDLFSRVLHGARLSLFIGVLSVLVALILGVPIGLLAGYAGGRTDLILMRGIDMMLAFPSILLAVVILSVLGPGLFNVMIAVGIVNVPVFTRQVRASALVLREQEFVLAMTALGGGPLRKMLVAILPNCLGPILVLATLGIGMAILESAGLGFIGLGIGPGRPEWGKMLSENRKYMLDYPWMVLFPGGAITATVLAFNLLGDALRDVLDPKRKRA